MQFRALFGLSDNKVLRQRFRIMLSEPIRFANRLGLLASSSNVLTGSIG